MQKWTLENCTIIFTIKFETNWVAKLSLKYSSVERKQFGWKWRMWLKKLEEEANADWESLESGRGSPYAMAIHLESVGWEMHMDFPSRFPSSPGQHWLLPRAFSSTFVTFVRTAFFQLNYIFKLNFATQWVPAKCPTVPNIGTVLELNWNFSK